MTQTFTIRGIRKGRGGGCWKSERESEGESESESESEASIVDFAGREEIREDKLALQEDANGMKAVRLFDGSKTDCALMMTRL